MRSFSWSRSEPHPLGVAVFNYIPTNLRAVEVSDISAVPLANYFGSNELLAIDVEEFRHNSSRSWLPGHKLSIRSRVKHYTLTKEIDENRPRKEMARGE